MAELPQHIPQAGFPVVAWCRSAGICRAHHYALPDEFKPKWVKIGKRRIITEPPAEWLARMAARGGVPIPQRKTP